MLMVKPNTGIRLALNRLSTPNRKIMKWLKLLPLLLLPFIAAAQKLENYVLITWNYHLPQQESVTGEFVKEALLPALHRAGYRNIGVFKPAAADSSWSGKRLYLLIPCKNPGSATNIDRLFTNKEVMTKGATYLNADPAQPPYDRKEVTILQAFSGLPEMELPKLTGPMENRIYELRSYEGPTELKYKAKVSMFNDGDEIGLFRELGMNGIFYGEVIAGSRMPNLMYMTAFPDMATRDKLWKAFFSHPKWKQLLTVKFYEKSVSKADIFLLQPMPWSDY